MSSLNRPITEHKFTKGEWHVIEYAGYYIVQDSPFYDGKGLLDIEDFPEEEVIANGRLISQAPNLLQIAEMYFDSMKGNVPEDSLPFQLTLQTLKKVSGYE